MSTTETLETRGEYRARIELDDCPDAPENDTGDPILDTETGELRYGGVADTYPSVVHPTVARVVEALDKTRPDTYSWRGEWDTDTFERYVRIFHGGTVTWVNGGARDEYSRYAALALPEYRRSYGCPTEHLNDPADTSEWTAYVQGDVYGVHVDRKVIHVAGTLTLDRDVLHQLTESEGWETVDDCWGFYGREYAEESARDLLNDWAE